MASVEQTDELLRRLSRRVAAIYGEQAECVPPAATASLDGHVVSVIFSSELTPNERQLVWSGSGEGVRQLRLEMQDGMREAMSAAVEEALSRRVLACLNANHVDPNLAVAVFVLDGHELAPSGR